MISEEEKQFHTYLAALATMTQNFTLSREIIAVFDEAASKIGYGKSVRALKQFIAEKGSRDPFPSVSDLIAKTEFNNLDPEEIAMKIFGAVTKFGPYRGADAHVYLGDIAWDIVLTEGGWESICQMLTYDNAPTLQAQWRKLAAVMIQRKKTKKMEQVGFFSGMQAIGESPLIKQIVSETEEEK
jgi:hypothetical protein